MFSDYQPRNLRQAVSYTHLDVYKRQVYVLYDPVVQDEDRRRAPDGGV